MIAALFIIRTRIDYAYDQNHKEDLQEAACPIRRIHVACSAMWPTLETPLSILSPDELQWYGEWLSEAQIEEAILRVSRERPGCRPSVIFNVLEAMRSRVEDGLPAVGDLWENPSAAETQQAIDDLNRRAAASPLYSKGQAGTE